MKNGLLISGDTLISFQASIKQGNPYGANSDAGDEGDSEYEYIKSMKSVVIPKKIKVIGYGAFYASPDDETTNDTLKNVTFEKGSKLKNIRAYAFSRCCGIKKMTLPKSVKSVDKTAFKGSYLSYKKVVKKK